ncbi:MAG: hypothetical protein C4532_08705 [Candidatus Abyssobacteria bacterium SURF_17]|uniref:Uncharacterized protein n=1 Tax=Candidatus Abyssobacteria bacterium SURF_17 TaxID=2093361 RepID=A0A419EZF8_9BACT|nr:MAG: hypothetical protein C4532_08705 [Candidatus Abyssubacteria bacterium SURF_17]
MPGRLEFSASGGLVGAPKNLSAIGAGDFRLNPLEDCVARIEYDGPVYLLTYEKLQAVLRNRFNFEIRLGERWRENLWPHVFDYYMRFGEWPLVRADYVRIFRNLLSTTRLNKVAGGADGKLEKVRRRVAAVALLRLASLSSARKLAVHTQRLTEALLASDSLPEIEAEMEMFRSLRSASKVIPLAGEHKEDALCLKVPFQLASPRRISLRGAAQVEYRQEYHEYFDRAFLCSLMELYPVSPVVLVEPAEIFAPRAQIPIDAGKKRVYGFTQSAPFICKGEDVSITPAEPTRHLLELKKQPPSGPAADPANFYLRAEGIEA